MDVWTGHNWTSGRDNGTIGRLDGTKANWLKNGVLITAKNQLDVWTGQTDTFFTLITFAIYSLIYIPFFRNPIFEYNQTYWLKLIKQ